MNGGQLEAGRRHSVAARQCVLVKATVTVVHAHAAHCTLHAAQEIAIDPRPALAHLGRPLEVEQKASS